MRTAQDTAKRNTAIIEHELMTTKQALESSQQDIIKAQQNVDALSQAMQQPLAEIQKLKADIELYKQKIEKEEYEIDVHSDSFTLRTPHEHQRNSLQMALAEREGLLQKAQAALVQLSDNFENGKLFHAELLEDHSQLEAKVKSTQAALHSRLTQQVAQLDAQSEHLRELRDSVIAAINSDEYQKVKQEFLEAAQLVTNLQQSVQRNPVTDGYEQGTLQKAIAKMHQFAEQLNIFHENLTSYNKQLDTIKKEREEIQVKLTKLETEQPKLVQAAAQTTAPAQIAQTTQKPKKEGVDLIIHRMAKAFGRDSISKEEKRLADLAKKVINLDKELAEISSKEKKARTDLEKAQKEQEKIITNLDKWTNQHLKEMTNDKRTPEAAKAYLARIDECAIKHQENASKVEKLTKEAQEIGSRKASLKTALKETTQERDSSRTKLTNMKHEADSQKQQAKQQQNKGGVNR